MHTRKKGAVAYVAMDQNWRGCRSKRTSAWRRGHGTCAGTSRVSAPGRFLVHARSFDREGRSHLLCLRNRKGSGRRTIAAPLLRGPAALADVRACIRPDSSVDSGAEPRNEGTLGAGYLAHSWRVPAVLRVLA